MSTTNVVTPKITNEMMKSFNGDGDLVAWIAKAKLVAKLAKITDLASFLPLYLEGDALAVYLEMSDADQSDCQKIEEKLKEVFTDGPFVAYSKLIKVKWAGEPVDVYATELRRLVGLAGLSGAGAETLIKLAFVDGFPESIRMELQQVEGINNLKVTDLLSRARILVGNQADSVGAVAQTHGGPMRMSAGGTSRGRGSHTRSNKSGFRGRCFQCEGPHMAKDCPQKTEKSVRCFRCGLEGHLSYDCTAQKSENE